MPARTDAGRAQQDDLGFGAFDDLYNDFHSDDDPFASEPESGANKKKRKEPETDVLGITEEVNVKKRATVPRVKLDEDRLLSTNGIPKLRKRAAGLRLKGNGHEFSDAARLLSFYQLWLDDLFPKAKFLDALAMVEKAGHKTTLQKQRVEWINEGKPKRTGDDAFEEEETEKTQEAPKAPTRIAPIFENQRPKTPVEDDPFGDEDIYGVSPAHNTTKTGAAKDTGNGGDAPDDDDLDALMAEAEVQRPPAPMGSLFGSGAPKAAVPRIIDQDPDDDLDALIAEAEAEEARNSKAGNGEAAKGAEKQGGTTRQPQDEFDDLDALMAEAEAQPKTKSKEASDKTAGDDFADDEEAMAEMEGLW